MKIVFSIVFTLICLPVYGEEVTNLEWLVGAWVSKQKNSKITTLTINDTDKYKYIGTETTLNVRSKKPSVLSFENFEISLGKKVELTVFPSAQKSLTMKLASYDYHKVAFENKKHDFPQRWSFELFKDGTLVERATGNGRKIEIKFRPSK